MKYCCDKLIELHTTNHLIRHYTGGWFLWTQEQNFKIIYCPFCGQKLEEGQA